jgi:tellurite resistance protein TerC
VVRRSPWTYSNEENTSGATELSDIRTRACGSQQRGEFLSSVATPALWTLFGVVVTGLLAVDLFLFHGKKRPLRKSEALLWSMVWIAVALLFNGFVCFQFGTERGLEFLTGYLIEKALAVDNLAVFVLIFSYFGIPSTRQHRVLLFGVVGALVLRAGFIAAGASLLAHFHWVGYLFGAFLAVIGLKLLTRTHQLRPETNPFFRLLRKVIPVINADADQFFVRRNSRLFATPLFLALLLIELSDIIFAVDSIPAIFAVTSDAFIVLTSNIFAILGLRAIYTLVADILVRLKYLRVGLALVLVFVGIKMLVASFYEIPVLVSLGAVAALLSASAIASLVRPRVVRPLA